ncbi:MAG: aminoacyl-tRNA hydrolase [Caulobacteraceae bacterium]|nr:aminoacyl-tRNA hydrolase [Caulobacteraceae bacterium]
MIKLTEGVSLDESELAFTYIRASGPGGQNVNKVSTAAQLRFDARRSPALPEEMRERLHALAGARASRDGVIVITAQRFRSQERNRADALARLAALLARAETVQAPRRPTKPSRAARTQRLEAKGRRAAVKAKRGEPKIDD